MVAMGFKLGDALREKSKKIQRCQLEVPAHQKNTDITDVFFFLWRRISLTNLKSTLELSAKQFGRNMVSSSLIINPPEEQSFSCGKPVCGPDFATSGPPGKFNLRPLV